MGEDTEFMMAQVMPAEACEAAAPDGWLLGEFARTRNAEAFAELVRRHGPMVRAACRRILDDLPEADDAFQATFMVLARKAGSIRRAEQLGNWLYGVALRCAKRVKSIRNARRKREQPMADVPGRLQAEAAEWHDVRPLLDEEIGRLPNKLRAAIVLCELEGLGRAEAAARLAISEGTLSSRLARAKDALRKRLQWRGVALSAAGIAALLMEGTIQAAVPAALVESVTRAAIGFAAGGAAAAGTGSVAAGIAMKEVAAMSLKKMLLVAVLGIGALAVGGGTWIGVQAALPLVAADEKSDKDKFQGEWKITSAKMGGKDAEDDIVGKSVQFNGDKMMFKLGGTFALDPGKDPREITLTVSGEPAGRQKFAGIYKFDGGKLVLHIAHPGDDRPTDFETKPGTTTMLIVLERVKK